VHWWNGDGHVGWMAIWWILGAAVLAAVVWALVKSARAPAGSKESPMQILKRRYANGEINFVQDCFLCADPAYRPS
jgi:uncharacterized membrane protein